MPNSPHAPNDWPVPESRHVHQSDSLDLVGHCLKLSINTVMEYFYGEIMMCIEG